jgi:hypothetical protein
MRALPSFVLAGALVLASGCPDDDPPPTDAGGARDSGVDSGTRDAGSPDAARADGGDAGIPSRLERPPILPRPPNGRLPADLFPPR